MRSSSSVRTSGVFVNNREYVTHLKERSKSKLRKFKNKLKIQEQAKGIKAANNKINELVEAKEEQGRTLASVMVFLKHQGFTMVYLHLWRFDVVDDANPETFSSDADMWFICGLGSANLLCPKTEMFPPLYGRDTK
ncbi:hypothetical protein RHGRI_005118 [Rhododendron griersonianum]|uniref:Uncharacterized protein n=1 Tax=Rhododendron griersonianum TaxID=479676 RepID=A0AAV6LC43_9ERIC|nr:hypothetical protein RHGRI_005118 [Rhododendron griersonianum]